MQGDHRGDVPAAVDTVLAPLLGAAPAPARVVVATPSAVYARAGAVLVGLLAAGAVRVPGALLPAADAPALLARLPLGAEIVVGAGVVHAGGVRLVPARWWDSRVPRLRAPAVLAAHPVAPLPDGLGPAVEALDAVLGSELGSGLGLEAAAARLVGLGPGLTPAGDDVLAGVLVALAATGAEPARTRLAAAVRPLRHRTTAVSAAFLDHAAAGRAVPQLARYLRGLAEGRLDGAVVQDLERVGGTSGAALAHGARIGLRVAALTGSRRDGRREVA